MSSFNLAISCLTTSNLPWFMDLTFQVPILCTASDLASITSHIYNWVLFLLWLCLFILSGVTSPVISSSILGTYQPGEFIFQCPIHFAFSCCSWGSQGKNTEKWKKVKVKSLSHVQLFVTPWTVAHQAPLSMGFSRQEYWSGLPFPSPRDLPDPGIEPRSPAL